MNNLDSLNREMIAHLQNAAKYYPIVSLAGPRQAGKSTLLKLAFPEYEYVSMENPDTALLAQTDPRVFFERYSNGVIIDEAQKMPEIFSYLQGVVDADRVPGRYVLSGSQNYLLHRNITQSLAGRVDLSTLYPLDFEEMAQISNWSNNVFDMMIKGFYPGRWTLDIPTKMFYNNYIRTYLERDVSDLVNVGNLTTFRTFLKLIAHRCGSQIKYNDLSNDLNISVNTIKSWVTILESGYIIFLLPPYHKNFGKRLIKSPKLYFYDTGLLCHLLGLSEEEKLSRSDKLGFIFENMVIAEKVKYNAHRHLESDLFFFRDSNGLEVDLIEVKEFNKSSMYEIKSGMTFKSEFLTPMKKLKSKDPHANINVIFNGADTIRFEDYTLMNWRNIHDYE